MDAFRAATGWAPERNLEECIPLVIDYERARLKTPPLEPDGVVMISSVSGKVPLVRRMKEAAAKLSPALRIEGADSAASPLARHFIDTFWQMPKLADLTAESLVAHCRTAGVRAIVPTRDGELGWFANVAPQLAHEGIHVMISQPAAIDACVDKLRFATLPGAIPAFAKLPADTSGPWVVKERFGAGSRSIGLNLDAAEALAHAKDLSDPIFQRFVAGQEVSADLYVDRKRHIKGCVVRTRDLVVGGESQITTTIDAPAVEAACRRILESLPFYGHVVFQAIIAANGEVRVIECNARFGGASSLSIAAGLDSFYWFLLEAAGEDLEAYPFLYDATRPLRQVRYASDHLVTL
jgi:carbamoyl-phosphate synthase large subunit